MGIVSAGQTGGLNGGFRTPYPINRLAETRTVSVFSKRAILHRHSRGRSIGVLYSTDRFCRTKADRVLKSEVWNKVALVSKKRSGSANTSEDAGEHVGESTVNTLAEKPK